MTAIVLITHQKSSAVEAMCRGWKSGNPEAGVVAVHGGLRTDCDGIQEYPAVFVNDPRLRTRDHQRERQSYAGVMRAASVWMEGKPFERVLLAEYDTIPLRPGICAYLEERLRSERADVLGLHLRRLDGTSSPHYLAHLSHPKFADWLAHSVRRDRDVVLSMLGCLSYWKRKAFEETAQAPEPMPVYLELALATVPHQLGFRVRGLPDWEPFFSPAGDVTVSMADWRRKGAWAAHPAKDYWLPKEDT